MHQLLQALDFSEHTLFSTTVSRPRVLLPAFLILRHLSLYTSWHRPSHVRYNIACTYSGTHALAHMLWHTCLWYTCSGTHALAYMPLVHMLWHTCSGIHALAYMPLVYMLWHTCSDIHALVFLYNPSHGVRNGPLIPSWRGKRKLLYNPSTESGMVHLSQLGGEA